MMSAETHPPESTTLLVAAPEAEPSFPKSFFFILLNELCERYARPPVAVCLGRKHVAAAARRIGWLRLLRGEGGGTA